MKKDDWVLIYEGGSGCISLFSLPLAVASLFGVVLCLGNLLELAALLRLPGNLELSYTRSSLGHAWSEGTVIVAYLLLVGGVASGLMAWKTLEGLWKSTGLISPVVYQGVLSQLQFEYPGRAPEFHPRDKSTITYWCLTAGDQTWKIRHSAPRPFEYALNPGAEIRVKYPSRGGPHDLIELWVNKESSNLEARLERVEWLQVYGQQSIWKLLALPLGVVGYYLPCIMFLLAASLFGLVVWVGNLLQFAGFVVLSHDLDLHLEKEWMRAAGYEKALLGGIYLVAGALAAGLAWRILKQLWQQLVAMVLPPLVYEGRLDKVYEAPHNRYGFYWELTAGGNTWRIDTFTSGTESVWFRHQITPGKEIRVVYPRGGGTAIRELWLKEIILIPQDPELAEAADDPDEADDGDSADSATDS